MADFSQQDVKTASKVSYLRLKYRNESCIISVNNFDEMDLNFRNWRFKACVNFLMIDRRYVPISNKFRYRVTNINQF